MNLPYTMGIEQAAEGVLEFAPGIVYSYHYRGKDKVSDIDAFVSLVNDRSDVIQVVLHDGYT